MADDFTTQQKNRAAKHLAEFLDAHPGYSVRPETSWHKGTHLVNFGQHREKPVVFKFYDGDPRRGYEQEGLEAFLPTGLVPAIYDQTNLMLVLERLPGTTIHEIAADLSAAQREKLAFALGECVAKIVRFAPTDKDRLGADYKFRACDNTEFYNASYDALTELYRKANTNTLFDTTLARAARVLRERPVPNQSALDKSLADLGRNRDFILSRPGFIHMDDFHENNIMTDGTRITGLIDLEMTIAGNELLLLATALSSLRRNGGQWLAFRKGYEKARGSTLNDDELHLIKILAPFSQWIRFTWYCSIDNPPWWALESDLGSSTAEYINQLISDVEVMHA